MKFTITISTKGETVILQIHNSANGAIAEQITLDHHQARELATDLRQAATLASKQARP